MTGAATGRRALLIGGAGLVADAMGRSAVAQGVGDYAVFTELCWNINTDRTPSRPTSGCSSRIPSGTLSPD